MKAYIAISLLRIVFVLTALSCFIVPSLWAGSFSYVLELEGANAELYSEMTGFISQSQVIDKIVTGTDGEVIVTKEPGGLSLTGFTMTRQLSGSLMAWDWRKTVQENRIDEAKQNGSVIMLDDVGNQIARWNFTNGWPSSLQMVMSGEQVLESLAIVLDKFIRVPVTSQFLNLLSFTATTFDDHVDLTFESVSETNVTGFYIQRSKTRPFGFERVNSTMIPATGTQSEGARYNYSDTQVVPGFTYFYMLECINNSGESFFYPMSEGTIVDNIDKIKQVIVILRVLSGMGISDGFATRLTEEHGMLGISDAISLLQDLSEEISLP